MDNIELFICKLFDLRQHAYDGEFYSFKDFSLNKDNYEKIYYALRNLCDRGVLKGFNYYEILNGKRIKDGAKILSYIRSLDEHDGQIPGEDVNPKSNRFLPGVKIYFSKSWKKKLAKIIEEETKLFIVDDLDTTNLGYEVQKDMMAGKISSIHSKNRKKTIKLNLHELYAEMQEVDVLRTLLGIHHEKGLKIIKCASELDTADDFFISIGKKKPHNQFVGYITITDFYALISKRNKGEIKETSSEPNEKQEKKSSEEVLDGYELARSINNFNFYRHKKSKKIIIKYNKRHFKAENSWLIVLCLLIERSPHNVLLETIMKECGLDKATVKKYISYLNRASIDQFEKKFIEFSRGSEMYSLCK